MLLVTFATAKFIPNDREATIKSFKATFAGYMLWMLMMHLLTGASFTDQNLPVMAFFKWDKKFYNIYDSNWLYWMASEEVYLLIGSWKNKT